MNEQTILDAIQRKKDKPAKAVRVCMYASFSPSFLNQSEALYKKAAALLGMTSREFHQALAEQHRWWSEKELRISSQILDSSWMKSFLKKHASLFSDRTITRSNACYLIADMLSMALQKQSANTLTSHLRVSEAQRLLLDLQDPGGLKKVESAVLAPVLQAARGRYSISSDDFIQRTLAVSEILACYLQALDEDGQGARTETAREFLCFVKKASPEQLAAFIDSRTCLFLEDEPVMRVRT